MNKTHIISVGTIYVDISCLQFPFDDALLLHKETVGKVYDLVPGGSAFNFARLCTHLNIPAIFVGKRGTDGLGQLLEKLVLDSGVTPHLVVDENAQTNIAVHYVREDGGSIMTSCGTANQSLSAETVTTELEKILPQAQYLYFGGCFKLKSLLPAYAQLAKLAKSHGVKVVVDHGRINNSVSAEDITHVKALLAQADYYLPSIDEFLATWEVDTLEDGFAVAATKTPAVIVVKNSEQGVVIYDNKKMTHVPAFTVKVLNSVGAGDSFNAGLLAGLSAGKSIEESAKFASAVAAVKISTLDEISLEKVMAVLESNA